MTNVSARPPAYRQSGSMLPRACYRWREMRFLRCHGRVGGVLCAFLWCPARSICRRRRHARNPFACTRSGDRRRSMWTRSDLPDRRGGQTDRRADRCRGSSPTMPSRRPERRPRPGSRSGRMIPEPARRSKRRGRQRIRIQPRPIRHLHRRRAEGARCRKLKGGRSGEVCIAQ